DVLVSAAGPHALSSSCFDVLPTAMPWNLTGSNATAWLRAAAARRALPVTAVADGAEAASLVSVETASDLAAGCAISLSAGALSDAVAPTAGRVLIVASCFGWATLASASPNCSPPLSPPLPALPLASSGERSLDWAIGSS